VSGEKGPAAKAGIRAVDRVADILECFAGAETLSFSDVCARAGLSKSTAHRFLGVLEKRQMVQRDADTHRFRIGPAILRVAALGGGTSYLQELAAPVMEELRDRTGETVGLTIRIGDHRVAILQCESRQELRRKVEIGKPFPIHLGGAGKIMLAYAEPEDRARVLKAMPREAITPYTPVDPELLATELERARRLGYAISDNEYIMGVISLGAPIFDRSGRVIAGLGLTGPRFRFTNDTLGHHVAALIEACRKISLMLGHAAPSPSAPEIPAAPGVAAE